MGEGALEQIIPEKAFAVLLAAEGEMFFRLAGTLLAREDAAWSRRHFFQLASEADAVEAFLDDFDARHNRTFAFLRELIASARGFALAGFSIAHLERRLAGYPTALSAGEFAAAAESVARARAFLQASVRALLQAAIDEARGMSAAPAHAEFPESRWAHDGPRRKLPRNMGQNELESDEQKTAEVASRFAQAAQVFGKLGVARIADEDERERWLQENCTEERARSLEASVHNLQSAYDTWVKGTAVETQDARLPKLRGHASIALHLLEAVTQLVHFVERHERSMRDGGVGLRMQALVSRSDVRHVTLNHLLVHAAVCLLRGRSVAEDLLPSYTNIQEIEVVLRDDLILHARPAALIVGVVQRYGMPVELIVGGRTCNAGSILEMMVTVGSMPDARRLCFRGDEHPLRDLQLLFEAGLGEDGLDRLPAELAYLRSER